MGNSKHLSDKDLIDKCIAQDPESQRVLYDKFSDKMYAVCLRYATDRDHAKDLLQDGFIQTRLRRNEIHHLKLSLFRVFGVGKRLQAH